MTRNNAACACAGLLATCASLAAMAAADAAPSAQAALSSRKDSGLVSIMADPALVEGRLVLKIVAFNRTDHAAEFGAGAIRISTAAGKPVALISLERLIAETRAAAAKPAATTAGEHDPSNYSHSGVRPTGTGGAGEPDVSAFTGASNPTNGALSPHTHATGGTTPEKFDPQLQAMIANLNAAILHPISIAPAEANGGQVVTERLTFSRKEERALHLVVDFNGERHEFDFAVPAAH